MKPNVFIGSSKEQLEIAYAIQENLQYDCNPTVWTQGIFKLSSNALVDLLNALRTFDFGIFIFTPDDISQIRGTQQNTVRDNVVFEMGMFMGKLGKDRVFYLIPRDTKNFHLPTDLLGITPGEYDNNRSDGRLAAALGPFCNQVRFALKSFLFDNIEDLRDESTEAKRLAIEKPSCWEFLLFAELLQNRLRKTKLKIADLETKTVFIKTRLITGSEFYKWFLEAIKDLPKFALVLTNLAASKNYEAFGQDGQVGDVLNIKRLADKFEFLANELINWEMDFHKIEPPTDLMPVKKTFEGWARKTLEEIEKIPSEYRRIVSVYLSAGKVEREEQIRIVFPSINVIDELGDLFTDYFGKTGEWPNEY